MKNVLVLVHDDAGQESRLQAALDITRALDGHLTCLDVSILPVLIGDYADPSGVAVLMDQEDRRESANRARIGARVCEAGIRFGWIEAAGFLCPTIRDAAALADVIVLNRALGGGYPDMRHVVGEVLIKAGKPVVAVPETAKGFGVSGHALVAWDGSREATAALQAAVPLLRHAGKVTILQIDDGSVVVPAADAVKYLTHHDIESVVRSADASSAAPSAIILAAIGDLGASYLVMGGFGHSRFIEATLGGVTKRMLQECPVPLFLAH